MTQSPVFEIGSQMYYLILAEVDTGIILRLDGSRGQNDEHLECRFETADNARVAWETLAKINPLIEAKILNEDQSVYCELKSDVAEQCIQERNALYAWQSKPFWLRWFIKKPACVVYRTGTQRDASEREVEQSSPLSCDSGIAVHDLIGIWDSFAGSFPMLNEEWIFNSDGTGQWTCVDGAGTEVVNFEWKPIRKNAVLIKYHYTDGMDDVHEEPEGDEWELIEYEMRPVDSDVGTVHCLVNCFSPPNNPSFGCGMWPIMRRKAGVEL